MLLLHPKKNPVWGAFFATESPAEKLMDSLNI